MSLDILILTHNRPHLFTRCIDSVLNQTRTDVQVNVYVNNDTSDITEVYDDRFNIKYTYNRFEELSDIYRHLYNNSVGDYVLFLEDDDYLHKEYLEHITFAHDVYFTNYISMPILNTKGIKSISTTYQPRKLTECSNLSEFRVGMKYRYFQMSQMLFRRKVAKEFYERGTIPSTLDYDAKLLNSFPGESTIKYLYKTLWVQTTDGQDNVSFAHLNNE